MTAHNHDELMRTLCAKVWMASITVADARSIPGRKGNKPSLTMIDDEMPRGMCIKTILTTDYQGSNFFADSPFSIYFNNHFMSLTI